MHGKEHQPEVGGQARPQEGYEPCHVVKGDMQFEVIIIQQVFQVGYTYMEVVSLDLKTIRIKVDNLQVKPRILCNKDWHCDFLLLSTGH